MQSGAYSYGLVREKLADAPCFEHSNFLDLMNFGILHQFYTLGREGIKGRERKERERNERERRGEERENGVEEDTTEERRRGIGNGEKGMNEN